MDEPPAKKLKEDHPLPWVNVQDIEYVSTLAQFPVNPSMFSQIEQINNAIVLYYIITCPSVSRTKRIKAIIDGMSSPTFEDLKDVTLLCDGHIISGKFAQLVAYSLMILNLKSATVLTNQYPEFNHNIYVSLMFDISFSQITSPMFRSGSYDRQLIYSMVYSIVKFLDVVNLSHSNLDVAHLQSQQLYNLVNEKNVTWMPSLSIFDRSVASELEHKDTVFKGAIEIYPQQFQETLFLNYHSKYGIHSLSHVSVHINSMTVYMSLLDGTISVKNPRLCIESSEPGAGKTRMVCMSIIMMPMPVTFIVCSKNAQSSWITEIDTINEKTTVKLKYKVVTPTNHAKIASCPDSSLDVVICTEHYFREIIESKNSWKALIHRVVFDEAQTCAQMEHAINHELNLDSVSIILIVSTIDNFGKPTQTQLIDIVKKFISIDKSTCMESLYSMTSRRKKQSTPEVVIIELPLVMTEEQQQEYIYKIIPSMPKYSYGDYKTKIGSQHRDIIKKIQKELTLAWNKLDFIVDYVNRTNIQKFVICTDFSVQSNEIHTYLKQKYDLFSICIDPQKTSSTVTNLISAFDSDPTIRVAVISATSGSYSLNLQTAEAIIYLSAITDSETAEQSHFRICRYGQKHNVIKLIYPYYKHTIEELLFLYCTQQKNSLTDVIVKKIIQDFDSQIGKLKSHPVTILDCFKSEPWV